MTAWRFSMAATAAQAKAQATRRGIRRITWYAPDGTLHHFVRTTKWHEIDGTDLVEGIRS